LDLIEARAGTPAVRHPWEEARLAFFLRVLAAVGLPERGSRILDVGAGDAWFASRLVERAQVEVTCWDVEYGRHPLPQVGPGVRLTAEAPAERFPLVLALDVLEHVADDAGFLKRVVADNLGPGGHVLVSVPAWPVLFSRHDEVLGHVRRYTPRAGHAVLEGAGLQVLWAGGLFHPLILPRAIHKWAPSLTGDPTHAGEWRAPGWVTALVRGALAADNAASMLFARLGWEVPGLSWWALCRRR
jgi:SAM-dependent methyltransferase